MWIDITLGVIMGKTSAAVKTRYNKKAYDRFLVTVKKGEKDLIKSAADAVGKSMNSYIVEAVKDKMES